MIWSRPALAAMLFSRSMSWNSRSARLYVAARRAKPSVRVLEIHARVGFAVHPVDELALGLHVRVPDFLRRDAQRVAQAETVLAPAGDVLVEQRLERGRHPCRRVDAVGDGVDLILGEHVPRDLGVFLGDAVDVVAQVEREVRHVQLARRSRTRPSSPSSRRGRGRASPCPAETCRGPPAPACGW